MAQDLQVNILSPAKVVARTKASHVLVPGADGYLGVLPGHTKYIGALGVGELKVDSESGEQKFFVAGGFIEVAADTVTLMVDIAERPNEIDVGRAEKAKARALERLEMKVGIDMQRAQAALLRANQRLTVARLH